MKRDEWLARRIKLRDLNTLRAVVEAGSMAKAAQVLGMSQPAISKAIADLEHALDVPLLDRSPRGVAPTEYGRVLLDREAVIFDELRQGLEQVEFLKDPTAGEIRIGATEPMTLFVSAVIQRLSQEYPRVVFHVTVGDTGMLYRELRHRSIDVAVTRMAEPSAEDDLRTEVLLEDPLVVMAGQGNPWVDRPGVELADLMGEPWTLSPPGSFLSGFVEEAFRHRGLEPPQAAVLTLSVQMRINLLATGRFLSILPSAILMFPSHHPALRAVAVDLAETRRPIGLVTLRHRTRSPVTELFLAAAQSRHSWS
jgi:DNA-binding transcriptional LysR family regulator